MEVLLMGLLVSCIFSLITVQRKENSERKLKQEKIMQIKRVEEPDEGWDYSAQLWDKADILEKLKADKKQELEALEVINEHQQEINKLNAGIKQQKEISERLVESSGDDDDDVDYATELWASDHDEMIELDRDKVLHDDHRNVSDIISEVEYTGVQYKHIYYERKGIKRHYVDVVRWQPKDFWSDVAYYDGIRLNRNTLYPNATQIPFEHRMLSPDEDCMPGDIFVVYDEAGMIIYKKQMEYDETSGINIRKRMKSKGLMT